MAYLSAGDFLAGIMGKAEDYSVPGVGKIRIRPLGMAEVRELYNKYGNDNLGLTLGAVAASMEEPKLSEGQVAQLERAMPGPVTELAQRIMQLSGMIPDAKIEEHLGN